MATTAIFAEILIVGLQAMTWLSLLVVARYGTDWFHERSFDGWQALLTIVVVAAAYVLGILVDRLADTTGGALERVWRPRRIDTPVSVSAMRLRVLREGGELARFSEYQRSRSRVARATVVNGVLTGVAVLVYARYRPGLADRDAVAIAAVLVLAAVAAELVDRRIGTANVRRLRDAYAMLEPAKSKPRFDRAAAIPYRRANGGLELLVVATSDGERWTFPKGHFEPEKDDAFADAARREAREEAGVEGKVRRERLTEFRYPGGKNGRRVAAFLLEVRKDGLERRGSDRDRALAWLEPQAAAARLADKRDEPYALELRRVVDEAVAALEAR